jgi:hypothetical protein
MAKKAYLVEFSITTRVVIDSNKDPNEDDYVFEDIVCKARTSMLKDGIAFYINGDNVSMIEEDTECPYDPETDD